MPPPSRIKYSFVPNEGLIARNHSKLALARTLRLFAPHQEKNTAQSTPQLNLKCDRALKLATKILVTMIISNVVCGSAYAAWEFKTGNNYYPLIESNEAAVTTTNAGGLGTKFIEIKAFEVTNNRTEYMAGNNFTATQLLSLVQQIHGAIGNFNIIRFIRVQCNNGTVYPNLMASEIYGSGYNWNGTLNSYVSAIQQAAGGQIIPDADLDPYFGQTDCGGVPEPQQFYDNAASLLTLSAIAKGDRYVMLEAYDAWYACPKDGNVCALSHPDETQVVQFFENMTKMGWQGFIPEDNQPNSNTDDTLACNVKNNLAPDFGYAGYVRNGIFVINQTSPYVFPNYNNICSYKLAEPYINGIVVGIESQLQPTNLAYYCGGKQYNYSIQAFAECLSPSQQEAALTNLARSQASRGFIFIYPVVVGEQQVQYDAQQAGTLGLMEQLINVYDSTTQTTTSSSLSSISASSSVPTTMTQNLTTESTTVTYTPSGGLSSSTNSQNNTTSQISSTNSITANNSSLSSASAIHSGLVGEQGVMVATTLAAGTSAVIFLAGLFPLMYFSRKGRKFASMKS